MNKRLYVDGLAHAITDEDLKNLFRQFGQVTSAQVIINQETGRSRGFGFVEMKHEAEARLAVNKLNETVFEDRTLTVILAHIHQEKEAVSEYEQSGY